MRLALDTNAYVAFCRADEKSVAAIQQASVIGVPLVVLGELRAGFLCGKNSSQNERHLQQFLASDRVEILEPDLDTTQYYARIFKQLRDKGTPIPTNDLWIASLVLQHGMLLLTWDKHFSEIPQMPLWG